jgi:aminopeptidase YwaD
MIGRLKDKTLVVSGSGTALESDSLLKAMAKDEPFSIKLSADGYGGSDQTAFYEEKIPVFFFYDGSTEAYHTPEDDVDKIDFESEKLILNYAFKVIMEVQQNDKNLTFREVTAPPRNSESKKYKASLGVIPDFTYAGSDGLRIDGVRKDGPAEKGGLIKGDVIIAVNKKPVKNIYEYMSRLEELKPGDKVKVDVIREGKKQTFIVQI